MAGTAGPRIRGCQLTAMATGVIVMAAMVVMLASRHRTAVGRATLWFGFVAPFVLVGAPTGDPMGGSVGLTEALRFGLPLLCLAVGWVSSDAESRGVGGPGLLLLAFSCWAFFSSIWSVAPTASLLKAATLSVQIVLAMVLVSRYRQITDLAVAFVGAATVLSLSVGVGAILSPQRAWLVLEQADEQRLSGVWPPVHPNMLAILGCIAVLGLLTRTAPKWMLHPLVLTPLVMAQIVLIVASRSRATLIIGAVLLLWAITSMARSRLAHGALIILSVTVSAFAAMNVADRFLEYLRRGQSAHELWTLTGRTNYWERALELWLDNPLLGFGYYSGHRLKVPLVSGQAVISNLDNVWIETAVDVGVVGVILLVSSVIYAGVRYWFARKQLPFETWVFIRSSYLLLSMATLYNPSLQTIGYAGAALTVLVSASKLVPGRSGVAPAQQGRTLASA